MLIFKADFYVRRDVAGNYSYIPGSVVYRDDLKLQQFDEVASLGASVLRAIENQVEHPLAGDHINLLTSYVASEVAQQLVLMKPEKYHDELEWRLAYSQIGESLLPVQHFDMGEPYLRLPLVTEDAPGDTRLPTGGVVLEKYAELSEDEVHTHLVSRGYDEPPASVRRPGVEPLDSSTKI